MINQDCKFIATYTVAFAVNIRNIVNTMSNILKQVVTDFVAQSFVDAGKIIKVNHKYCKLRIKLFSHMELQGNILFAGLSIVKTCQDILLGLFLNLLLIDAKICDVVESNHSNISSIHPLKSIH